MLFSAETHQGPRAAVLIKDRYSLNLVELELIQWQCGISSTFVCFSNTAHHMLYFPHSTFELINLQLNRKHDFCSPLVLQV